MSAGTVEPGAGAGDAVGVWAALLDALPHAAWVVDLRTRRVVAANASARTLLAPPQQGLVGQRAEHVCATPEDLAYWADTGARAPGRLRSDTALCASDGRVLHVERCITPLAGAGGAPPVHCLVTLLDRSAQQRADEAREQTVAELQATLEATADGILVTDVDGRVRAFNRRFAQLWDIPEHLLRQRNDGAIQSWMQRCVHDTGGDDAQAARAPGEAGAVQLRLRSGQVLERVTRPLWSRGRAHGSVQSFRDLSARLAADHRFAQLAVTDALTGLPNRQPLADRVRAAAARTAAGGPGFALLVIDLDRFRHVNDSLGHEIGDRVLVDVAQRIQGCLRGRDLLARVAGDEFVAFLEDADAGAAESTARRVLNVVGLPCSVEGAQFTLTCSIGIALSPLNGHAVEELTRHAEKAMRAAKVGGRAGFRFLAGRSEGDLLSHMRLDHAMRQALVSGRFRLHYQPQMRLSDGALVGAEALIRWRDPELGDVSPARFIAVAEDSGFIVPIGDWVLSQAVRQATLWHQAGCGIPIAVNVSALQFQQPQFVDRVAGVLAVSGLPPELLELELTESILVRDADDALQRLHGLRRLGVTLSIDDFGTGYSSLAYLKRFPIGKLKIDRSFIAGLPGDESDAGIVTAILQMARALGKTVIAEGVETETQRAFLEAAGCDEAQGFLYAPALDARSFERHLAQHTAPPAPAAAPNIRLVR